KRGSASIPSSCPTASTSPSVKCRHRPSIPGRRARPGSATAPGPSPNSSTAHWEAGLNTRVAPGSAALEDRGNGLFGIYVHWPFCTAKCPYCDFNSHVHRGAFDEADFVAAYARELSQFAAQTPGRKVQSIFFGGGTPSLMNPRSVGTIIEAVARHW